MVETYWQLVLSKRWEKIGKPEKAEEKMVCGKCVGGGGVDPKGGEKGGRGEVDKGLEKSDGRESRKILGKET